MSSSPVEQYSAFIAYDFEDEDYPVDDPEMAFVEHEEWTPLEFVEDEEISFAESDSATVRYPCTGNVELEQPEYKLTEDDSCVDMRPHALFTNSTAQAGTYRAAGLCTNYMVDTKMTKSCKQRYCRGKTPTKTHDFTNIARCNKNCNTTRLMCGLWSGEDCAMRHDGESLDEYILRRKLIAFKTPRALDIQVVTYPDGDEMDMILMAAKQCNASTVNLSAKRYQL